MRWRSGWRFGDRRLLRRNGWHPNMNRLRKDPPATSRTLAIATGATHDSSHPRYNQGHTQRDVQPRTGVEQYWAARALKAETSLSARDTHRLEVQHLRDSEETKRSVRLCHGWFPLIPLRPVSYPPQERAGCSETRERSAPLEARKDHCELWPANVPLSLSIPTFLSFFAALSCRMHHFAIRLCDLSAVSRRSRQATAEAKSRPFYNPDPFALQFRRKFLWKASPDRVVLTAHRAGRAGELAYWDEDANRFGRCGGHCGIFSYSYLAVGPQM